MSDPIKLLDLDEFRNQGWLLEVNRLFFHPRGLALEVEFKDGHVVGLSGIWDYRDDPAGIMFDDTQFQAGDQGRADAIDALRRSKIEARFRRGCLGDGIQQIKEPESTPPGTK